MNHLNNLYTPIQLVILLSVLGVTCLIVASLHRKLSGSWMTTFFISLLSCLTSCLSLINWMITAKLSWLICALTWVLTAFLSFERCYWQLKEAILIQELMKYCNQKPPIKHENDMSS